MWGIVLARSYSMILQMVDEFYFSFQWFVSGMVISHCICWRNCCSSELSLGKQMVHTCITKLITHHLVLLPQKEQNDLKHNLFNYYVIWNIFLLLKSFEEAKLAMKAVKPVMLVIDESCYSWYFKFQQNDVPFLKWHVLLDSPSSDFTNKWNGRNIYEYLFVYQSKKLSIKSFYKLEKNLYLITLIVLQCWLQEYLRGIM